MRVNRAVPTRFRARRVAPLRLPRVTSWRWLVWFVSKSPTDYFVSEICNFLGHINQLGLFPH